MTDRMLKKGHIGHNKFVVYAKGKKAIAVLTGSTNWTPTGLCAQSNNAIVIESPALAEDYLKYWERLKADTENADSARPNLQSKPFRESNMTKRAGHDLNDQTGNASSDVHVWFSPNTIQRSVPKSKKK